MHYSLFIKDSAGWHFYGNFATEDQATAEANYNLKRAGNSHARLVPTKPGRIPPCPKD